MMPHSTGEPAEGSEEAAKSTPAEKVPNGAEHKDVAMSEDKQPVDVPEVKSKKSSNDATQKNAGDVTVNEADAESELSDPGSMPNSPPNLGDEIVVHDGDQPSSPPGPDAEVTEDEDASMAEAGPVPAVSPYPKRKRTATNPRFGEERLSESPEGKVQINGVDSGKPKASKPIRAGISGGKGVFVGHWRDSPVPDENRKHAVIGFIDVRDRLRTRIQGQNLIGEHVSNVWPLPPRTGASWVTFEGIFFLPHLVGLDQLQVKEYVRLRLEAPDETEEERIAAELAAVEEAKKIVRETVLASDQVQTGPAPHIAYGAEVPETIKRRRTSHGYAPGGSTSHKQSAGEPSLLDPLHGTRPTRILLGCWKKSEAVNREDKHAIYGILGANDMFRVKLVRETRSGQHKDGNFPSGPGALWIAYEQVDFDDHLKGLTRSEIKEYSRVRQYQIDQGESEADRAGNEIEAARQARARVDAGAGATTSLPSRSNSFGPGATPAMEEDEQSSPRTGIAGQELRTSRRVEAMTRYQQQQQEEQEQHQEALRQERTEQVNGRRATIGHEPRMVNGHEPVTGLDRTNALNRTNALAQRELSRAEAAQGRTELYATHRERAAAHAYQEANAASTTAGVPLSGPRNNGVLQDVNEMRRLNDLWARQETSRGRSTGDETVMLDGIKFERKVKGPFIGKLASSGNIVTVDGEEYVEYRVLTKPAFF